MFTSRYYVKHFLCFLWYQCEQSRFVFYFFLVTHSEIAAVSNIVISAITWCTAGEFQQRTAPELLPCGNAPFYFSGFWGRVAACRLGLWTVLGKNCECRMIFIIPCYQLAIGEHHKHLFHGSRAALCSSSWTGCLGSVGKRIFLKYKLIGNTYSGEWR